MNKFQKPHFASSNPIFNNMHKYDEFVIVRRTSDRKELSIPKKHLAETLKRGFELVKDDDPIYKDSDVEMPDYGDIPECGICGFEAKSPEEVAEHKIVHGL